ncbi:hypothetical protein MRX96_017620 [Rhipicephalus microplus]
MARPRSRKSWRRSSAARLTSDESTPSRHQSRSISAAPTSTVCSTSSSPRFETSTTPRLQKTAQNRRAGPEVCKGTNSAAPPKRFALTRAMTGAPKPSSLPMPPAAWLWKPEMGRRRRTQSLS